MLDILNAFPTLGLSAWNPIISHAASVLQFPAWPWQCTALFQFIHSPTAASYVALLWIMPSLTPLDTSSAAGMCSFVLDGNPESQNVAISAPADTVKQLSNVVFLFSIPMSSTRGLFAYVLTNIWEWQLKNCFSVILEGVNSLSCFLMADKGITLDTAAIDIFRNKNQSLLKVCFSHWPTGHRHSNNSSSAHWFWTP